MIHTVLTIAGSDPSGGAGIQADLKTFSSLSVYGMAVVAALTAQNTTGVRGVMEVPADFVGLQMDAVVTDIRPHATKTGMLGTAAVVEAVAQKIREHNLQSLVVDPVLQSSSGELLLGTSGLEALKRHLLPLALLVTPNASEAAALTGVQVDDVAGMEEAARRLSGLGVRNVLVKGGHVDEKGDAVDILHDGRHFERFSSARISTDDLHGTGCVLSAAIAAHLALGLPLGEAVAQGKAFVTESIKRSLRLGQGHGPVNPLRWI